MISHKRGQNIPGGPTALKMKERVNRKRTHGRNLGIHGKKTVKTVAPGRVVASNIEGRTLNPRGQITSPRSGKDQMVSNGKAKNHGKRRVTGNRVHHGESKSPTLGMRRGNRSRAKMMNHRVASGKRGITATKVKAKVNNLGKQVVAGIFG